MDDFKSLAIPLLVAIVSSGLTAYISIKLKFANDEAAAFRLLRNGFLRLISIAFNILVVIFLVREIISDEPVTRSTVLAISIYVATLCFAVLMSLIQRLVAIIEAIIKLQHRQIDGLEHAVAANKSLESKTTPPGP